MALSAGGRLGPYEILGVLGRGGMGEVYRAHDTRLGRPVAVKVLPPELLRDAERRRRFTQEARAASALNHPNIVTIHDIGSAGGAEFIVMELVQGKTLEDHIGRRPMALTSLLRAAAQIADALCAAHTANIIHRDLKPTNIMITDSGLIKILDFGLAKLASPPQPSATDETQTFAAAAEPTEAGAVMGTASFMSPEQAEGREIDARSDIFSFGAVLYEMATGRRAFQGATNMATVAAVLRDEPAPVSTPSAPLPHDLEKVIARCLKKDPARRFQHMADLKVALEELKEESETGRLLTTVSAAQAPTKRPSWIIPLVAAVAITAGGAAWLLNRQPAPANAAPITRLTSDTGSTTDPAISPDGKLLAYSSDRSAEVPNIWIQQLTGGQTVQLTKLESGAVNPSFSADGSYIIYQGIRKDAGIWVIPAIGGDPKKLAPEGSRPRFSLDGTMIAVTVRKAQKSVIRTIPAAGGEAKDLMDELDGQVAANWSPDGRFVLVRGHKAEPDKSAGESADWWVKPIAGGPAVRTGAAAFLRAANVIKDYDAVPAPDTWHRGSVYFSVRSSAQQSANIWRLPLDPKTFMPAGPAVQVTFGTTLDSSPSLSADGRLAFQSSSILNEYTSLPIDSNQAKKLGQRTTLMPDASSEFGQISLDGGKLLFCSNRSGNSDVWMRDLRTGKETSILASPAEEHLRALSASGSHFVYFVRGKKDPHFLSSIAGGQPKPLCENCGHVVLSPDGSRALYIVEPDHHNYYMMDFSTGKPFVFLKHEKYEFGSASFSPDGKWIVLVSRDNPMFLVPVRDSLVEEKDWIPVGAKGINYQWTGFSPNSAYLYFVSNEDGNPCIYAQKLDASMRPSGKPVGIEHFHDKRNVAHPHGMTLGADRLVLLMAQDSSNIWMTRIGAVD